MAVLLEQPHWPSHFIADKLGMKNRFTAASRRIDMPGRVQQRITLKRHKDTPEPRHPIRPKGGFPTGELRRCRLLSAPCLQDDLDNTYQKID
ncbi:MAG TPA: hypothetical protein VIG56_11605 [Pseudolabrys sp.]